MKYWLMVLVALVTAAAHAMPSNPARAYLRETVWPAVQAERAAFDVALSPAEQSQIAAVREEINQLRADFRARYPRGSERNETFRGAVQAHRMAVRTVIKPLQAVAEAHQTVLQTHLATLRADADQTWLPELRRLTEAHAPEGTPPAQRPHRLRRALRPVGFLLVAPAREPNTELTFFPNPATNRGTLQYELPRAGHVRARLLNGQGETVRELLDERLPIGLHTLSVDLTDLRPGVYVLTLETPTGVVSQEVVRQ